MKKVLGVVFWGEGEGQMWGTYVARLFLCILCFSTGSHGVWVCRLFAAETRRVCACFGKSISGVLICRRCGELRGLAVDLLRRVSNGLVVGVEHGLRDEEG